jgi:hypothetical protein
LVRDFELRLRKGRRVSPNRSTERNSSLKGSMKYFAVLLFAPRLEATAANLNLSELGSVPV